MTESTDLPLEVASVDATILAPILGRALGRDRIGLEHWKWTRLHQRDGGGVFRVSGVDTGDGCPWSLVLKVIPTDGDPTAVAYPAREQTACASVLLGHLPGGLVAPHCYQIDERHDGRVFLWLEDVADVVPGPWPVVRYVTVARHLGQLNGAYLSGRALPAYQWLRRSPVRLPEARLQNAVAAITRPGIWDSPLLREVFPRPVAGRLLSLWADTSAFEVSLGGLPQTLCHGDAFRRNLRFPSSNSNRMVALDWEHIGIGAVGEDPARLVALGLLFGDVEGATVTGAALSAAVWEGYLAGLRNIGWRGDASLARLGYCAACASFAIGIAGMVVEYVASPDEAIRRQPEQWFHRPIAAVAEQWADAIYLTLDLAADARGLLPTV